MRLIDAESACVIVEHLPKETYTKEEIYDFLQRLKTAYDPEKVVEELEKCIELKVTQYPLQGTYIKKNIAIDIVKKGGVD